MAQVVNWLLKVKDQKKVEETGNVRMNCLMNGQKKQDGSYCDGMWITVIIARSGDRTTKWDKPADYTVTSLTAIGKRMARRERTSPFSLPKSRSISLRKRITTAVGETNTDTPLQ